MTSWCSRCARLDYTDRPDNKVRLRRCWTCARYKCMYNNNNSCIIYHMDFASPIYNLHTGLRSCLDQHVAARYFEIKKYKYKVKKLSCRRETAQCFVSLNISLSHSRPFLNHTLLVFHLTVFQKKHVTTFLMISWSRTVRLERFLAHILLRVQAIDRCFYFPT